MDDGETFDYQNGQFLYWGFTYKKEGDQLYSISSKNMDKRGKMKSDIYVERIIIRGVRYFPTNVHIYLDGIAFFSAAFLLTQKILSLYTFLCERRYVVTTFACRKTLLTSTGIE